MVGNYSAAILVNFFLIHCALCCDGIQSALWLRWYTWHFVAVMEMVAEVVTMKVMKTTGPHVPFGPLQNVC